MLLPAGGPLLKQNNRHLPSVRESGAEQDPPVE